MPKPSRYNHFQPWENGGVIAYSAISGAVATMTDENYTVFRQIVEKLSADPGAEMDEQEQVLLRQLIYGKFVRPTEVDERDNLQFMHNMERYNQTGLGLVIAPTMACNMACTYCYENNKAGKMSQSVADSVVEFVKDRADSLDGLSVGWYGGEPLLALDVIEALTAQFRQLAEEHRFQYSASMVTNGYLLTLEMAERLVELKIQSVQVTIDGPARIHDAQRPLKNGKSSFDTILRNVGHASEKLSIGIRVNVGRKSDPETIEELLGELKEAGLTRKVRVYFGHIEPSTEVCANIAEDCYKSAEFSKVEIEYSKLMLENGFGIHKLPSPTSTFCMAQSVFSTLIDPDGDLYRCFNHVGEKSRSNGNIRDGINYEHANFKRMFEFSPFNEATCNECDLLPICMGGCPAKRADRNLTGEDVCPSWKHNLQPMLELIAQSRQQEIREQEQAAAVAKE